MDIITQMNQAIEYIEEHLEERMEMSEISKAAFLSSYHFQRIFHVLTGFTVAEYIRNRRLTLAALKLTDPTYTVTEVALQYGYESTDAFTKAFQRLHGVTPSSVKRGDVKIKAFSKLSLQVNITGKEELDYRIVKEDGYDMIGIDMQTASSDQVEDEIAAFCDQVWEDGSHHSLNEFLGFPIMHMLDGVHFDYTEDKNRRYLLGWKMPDKEVPKEYRIIHIPSNDWAVFEAHADMSEKNAINELWKRIYVEWFPSADFEQSAGPCIEKFEWEDEAYFKYKCEVWIPVRRK